ncbi:MAG: HAD-superfamily hydrolase, subfamily IIA [Candidatus Tokpelaia hoelldobleri]|uniref:HAD-superfamily hydrolase, subfamily IIA n=1 Tax=Candidatus Tokpelaia hoelldobleri TaxID=1902579 RepID=A0A1U9JTI6_9HYPH|nr:MAG: HAD-superfamily hydrolase, subfamily IIA [Candidatus Tokpelaia hoelldoblerii]
MKQLKALTALYEDYDVFLSDVWGVVHDGVKAYPAAVRALQAARQADKKVILITNSPRPRDGVIAQLRALGVPDDCYDNIVTSGDVTRELIREMPRQIFHIGPERDQMLYDGLDVELTEEYEAAAVVCTGLFDDRETPQDYQPLLQRLRSRNLPFVCANPDITVCHGGQMIWCSGALARDYTQLGGRTFIAGKPHRPIYDVAQHLAGNPDKARILAIGDGILTDVKGAEQNGLDILFIGGGVHVADYRKDGVFDMGLLEALLHKNGLKPFAFMMELA